MSVLTTQPTCHVKTCASAQRFTCASCGRPCCPDHVRHVSLERRTERVETAGHRGTLQRLPTRTETYPMCLRCSKKPIAIKW